MQLLIPIGLVIICAVDLGKMVVNPEEKSVVPKITKRMIAAVSIFFIPAILNILLEEAGQIKFTATTCWANANTSTISSLKAIKAEEEAKKQQEEEESTELYHENGTDGKVDVIDEFKYEYYTYKGILSLLITVTYYNDSEYGNIEYYSYNIKVDENKVLSNKELYNYLNINSEDVNKTIDKKMDSYFKQDTLNQELSFNEYKEIIGYEDKNNKLIIKDNKLYCYHSFKITQSLIDYKGNVNEIKIKDLAK